MKLPWTRARSVPTSCAVRQRRRWAQKSLALSATRSPSSKWSEGTPGAKLTRPSSAVLRRPRLLRPGSIPTGEGWAFELKYDGSGDKQGRLVVRSGGSVPRITPSPRLPFGHESELTEELHLVEVEAMARHGAVF